MKKMYLRSTIIAISAMFIFSLIGINGFSQIKREKKNYTVEFNQVRNNEMSLVFTVSEYSISKKEYKGISYSYINTEFGVKTTDAGYAELPMLNASVQLAPDKNVTAEVIYGTYEDINLDYPLLPSKGNLTRAVDPATIPYEIAAASLVDEWYPLNVTNIDEPYIFRDVRGTNVYVCPMQYNAVKKILRVYNSITVKLTENDETPINPLTYNKEVLGEMFSIYKSLFINYNTRANWTNEVGEVGDILVITTSTFESAITTSYIRWKRQMGYKVTLKIVATGTNVAADIKTAYAENNKILYVLLVGDWADIKTPTAAITTSEDPIDMMMGCVVGTDNYPDIIIGRFSAKTTEHVTTQYAKTKQYEFSPTLNGTWYKSALGIGSAEGSGSGDDGEDDKTHIGYLYTGRLGPFGYSNHYTAYDTSATPSMVSSPLNNGVGVINYCGHGSQTAWGTTGFSSTNVASLQNGFMLPIIFSVACVNGAYHLGDCFAEAWLRKDAGGAVAALMATANQDWTPPQKAQDYFADLMVGGHTYSGSQVGTNTDHGKTHFGSIVLNGEILMYSEGGSSTLNTLKTWVIFGDPSLQIRTDTPKNLTLDNEAIYTGSNTYNVKVDGTNFKGALVSIWDKTNNPISGFTDASGNITLNNTIPLGANAVLTITGYNLYTYQLNTTVASHSSLTTENIFNNTVKISPNPASSQVKISIDNAINGTYNVEIMNLAGQVILSNVFEKNSTYFTQEIGLTSLTKGAYLIKFSNNENIGFQKLLVN